jgi:hypothetical protein
VTLPTCDEITAIFATIDTTYEHSHCHFFGSFAGIVIVAVFFYALTAIHKSFNRKDRRK